MFTLACVCAAIVLMTARVVCLLWWPWWRHARHFVFRVWARMTLRILGITLTRRGTPPARPFLLVSNHLSYLDVLLFASTVDAVFVAKREVARWPFFGPLVWLLNTIFIDRSRRADVVRANARIEQALGRGDGVIVFAEGTSSDGRRILPLKPSLLLAAARGRAPLHYARVAYVTPPGAPAASQAVCWWGEMSFVSHFLGLLRLRRVAALVHFGPDLVTGDDRKALAQQLQARINALPAVID